jgi:hypothetical protein
VRPYLKEKCWVWWLTTVIPGIAGTLIEEYHGPGWPEQKKLTSKITTANRAGDLDQLVECLLSKGKVLSSNPS